MQTMRVQEKVTEPSGYEIVFVQFIHFFSRNLNQGYVQSLSKALGALPDLKHTPGNNCILMYTMPYLKELSEDLLKNCYFV